MGLEAGIDPGEADRWSRQKLQLAAVIRSVRIPALGDCREVTVTGPIHVSPHARLFRCALPQRNEQFLAKCFYVSGTEKPDTEEARLQYEALLELTTKRGATADFNLVTPYHLFAEEAVILQSWIDGESFDRVLAAPASTFSALATIAEGAGRWLAHFHTFGGHHTGNVSGTLMNEVAERGKALSRRGRLLVKAEKVMLVSELAQGRTMQPLATLHSDYKPANVIAAKDGVYAIDFQLSTHASIYFDLAHFLNSMTIDLLKARAMLGGNQSSQLLPISSPSLERMTTRQHLV